MAEKIRKQRGGQGGTVNGIRKLRLTAGTEEEDALARDNEVFVVVLLSCCLVVFLSSSLLIVLIGAHRLAGSR